MRVKATASVSMMAANASSPRDSIRRYLQREGEKQDGERGERGLDERATGLKVVVKRVWSTFRHSQECGNEDRVVTDRLISNKLV